MSFRSRPMRSQDSGKYSRSNGQLMKTESANPERANRCYPRLRADVRFLADFVVALGIQANEILPLPEAVLDVRITDTLGSGDDFSSARSAVATERALVREIPPLLF